jgi:GT2 family glycosyltransferase
MTLQHQPRSNDKNHANAQTEMRRYLSEVTPRLSVILCTYNRRNMLLSALASLRRQTLPYEQFEVIVIDNGSTDGTLHAVRSYVNAGAAHKKRPEDIWQVHCFTEAQSGLAYARNKGLQVAIGEIAVFLDDDTLADAYFLEHLLLAYEQTGADAIGGRVELRWEALRPYWLSEDMLDMLGYFSPFRVRAPLPNFMNFSSCSFSVKTAVLRRIGGFSLVFNKRRHVPISMDVDDLCYRLRKVGYTLWYDPAVVVAHRAHAARLKRSFFIGRAYWHGRSEVLVRYADIDPYSAAPLSTFSQALHEARPTLREIARIALVLRPLLFLCGKSTNEHLHATMAQAHAWGHVWQQFQSAEHAAGQQTTPETGSSWKQYAQRLLDIYKHLLNRNLQL